jgi:hypothetical protein
MFSESEVKVMSLATTNKEAALVALVGAMKTDLRYTENTVDCSNKLMLVGGPASGRRRGCRPGPDASVDGG